MQVLTSSGVLDHSGLNICRREVLWCEVSVVGGSHVAPCCPMCGSGSPGSGELRGEVVKCCSVVLWLCDAVLCSVVIQVV